MQLTVKQLKNRDPGSGMAVIDREALGEADLSSGDFVAIEGRDGSRTIARTWPSDTADAGRGIVRIDGQLRREANVSIDDRVPVEKTDVEPAERVTVALPGNPRIQGDLGSHLREHLVDQAVTPGQTVAFPVGFGLFTGSSGRRIPLRIVDTEPTGTVVIRNATVIEVADRGADEVIVEGEEVEAAPAPAVTYEDVGGLDDAKERLRETIQWPLEHADAYERVALDPAKGVLLYGPPGTGKTLLAKAVANEADSNFISIKGPELFDKYVGESEKAVREVFEKARANAPTVVFFDEIDAIATERGRGAGDSNVGERVVSQLLSELDGLEELEDVVVIATTNRPDLIDEALLRPGRIDRHVEVGEPDEAARRAIFEIHTRDRPLAENVDLDDLAARTEDYVGADNEAVCREAATIAVREYVHATAEGEDEDAAVEDIELTMDHFERALSAVESSADEDERSIEGMPEGV